MEPILTIDNLNSFGGNMLRQGDKSQLKYRLRDVGNKNLTISGKSCQVKMYGRNYTTVVYETTATVSTENTVSFTIDKVLPKGTFYLEFTVGDYIFPTDHREFFEITPSGKGVDANIIEIVGKDVLINAVKSQVDTELQPLVTTLQSAEQAETQRASEESARASAEAQRKIDHANRSAELASKADKVVIKNLAKLDSVGSPPDMIYHIENDEMVVTQFSTAQREIDRFIIGDVGDKFYSSVEMKSSDSLSSLAYVLTRYNASAVHSGSGEWESLSAVDELSVLNSAKSVRFLNSTRSGDYSDDPVRIRKPILINLTETFGAGNEPAKEEMDELIKVVGYIDGEYAINNSEMLGHLMKGIGDKADKKQEDWITPTLTSGWEAVSNIAYMKDELGFVHLRGRINNGLKNQPAFTLPTGYTPKDMYNGFLIPVGTTGVGLLSITSRGLVNPTETSDVWIDLISVKFRAEE